MPLVTERTVKRFYVNGKGFASKSSAYWHLAKRELLREIIREHFNGDPAFVEVVPMQKGTPEWTAMSRKYAVSTYDQDNCCPLDEDYWEFDTKRWHADIRKRAAEILSREEG